MYELEHIKCALCGKDKEDLLMRVKNTHGSKVISGEDFNLVRCKDCGLIYVNPRPKQDEIEKFYNIDYYTTENRIKASIEKYLTCYFNLQRKRFIAKYKRSGKLIDIGCGTGEFLLTFVSNKWDLYGIEPNITGFNLSRKKVKGRIFNDQLSNCKFPNEYFDVVTMWHVFEHISEPSKELQEINRVLKKDGIFIMATPNVKSLGFKVSKANWFHMDCPRHLYHYDSMTINKILNKHGFEVFKMAFPSVEYPLDLYHSLLNLLGKNGFVKAPLSVMSLLLKPLCSLFKISETMIILSRKKAQDAFIY